MHPTGTARTGKAPGAAWLARRLVRVGVAVVVMLAGMSALVPAASADSASGEPQQADASNGGVATTTADGNVDIGEIITGENTGNSIATGDITGPAELHGGEINYPTEVVVTLIIEPSVATADGGDGGTANSSDESESDGGKNGEDITIINRNDNRSSAEIVE